MLKGLKHCPMSTTVLTNDTRLTVRTGSSRRPKSKGTSMPCSATEIGHIYLNTDAVRMVALTTLRTGEQPPLCALAEAAADHAHVLAGRTHGHV